MRGRARRRPRGRRRRGRRPGAELSCAVGLGGRHRSVGGDAERARTSVTRSIRYALARLADHHPPVAAHLDQCVRTGTYCSYVPDPLVRVEWHLTPSEPGPAT